MIFGISEWIILLMTVIGLTYYYFWKKTQYFKDRNIVFEETTPLLGSTVWSFMEMEHIKDFFDKVYYKFPTEKYFGIFSFTTPVVILKDLDLLKQIAIKDFDHFTDHVPFADRDVDPLSANMLLLLEGEQWREMRITLSPAFTSSKMRGMFPLMQDCSNNLVNYVDKLYINRSDKDKDYIDLEMKDTFSRCTNDIIATCGFGIQTNSLVEKDNDFYKMTKAFITFDFWENFKFAIYSACPQISKLFGLQFGNKKVSRFFKSLVLSNMKEREEKNIVRQDMIHLLMLAKQGKLSDETGDGQKKTKLEWSDDEMVAQVLIFLFAGFESTANMLSFLAYELSKDSKVQKKVQEEIDSLLENGELDYNGISNLKYLDMVCSETLRLWPIVPNTDRVCTKPYTLPPPSDKSEATLKLHKGDQIWIPTMSIHRDQQYFPNPNKFDPERFSDENKDSIVPYSYLPFGLGPRQCIGTRFALMEIKLLIANLLIKYDLVKTPKTPDPMVLKNSIFDMIPVNGFWVGLKPRKTITTLNGNH